MSSTRGLHEGTGPSIWNFIKDWFFPPDSVTAERLVTLLEHKYTSSPETGISDDRLLVFFRYHVSIDSKQMLHAKVKRMPTGGLIAHLNDDAIFLVTSRLFGFYLTKTAMSQLTNEEQDNILKEIKSKSKQIKIVIDPIKKLESFDGNFYEQINEIHLMN